MHEPDARAPEGEWNHHGDAPVVEEPARELIQFGCAHARRATPGGG